MLGTVPDRDCSSSPSSPAAADNPQCSGDQAPVDLSLIFGSHCGSTWWCHCLQSPSSPWLENREESETITFKSKQFQSL